MYLILSLILFQVYACLDGYGRCGEYWYLRNNYSNREDHLFKNPHPLWFITRVLVGVGMSANLLLTIPLHGIIFLIGLGSTFFLWHDGFYYLRRNQLYPMDYPKRFFDYSTTSKANMTFPFADRLFLCILGNILSLLITYYG